MLPLFHLTSSRFPHPWSKRERTARLARKNRRQTRGRTFLQGILHSEGSVYQIIASSGRGLTAFTVVLFKAEPSAKYLHILSGGVFKVPRSGEGPLRRVRKALGGCILHLSTVSSELVPTKLLVVVTALFCY